VLTDKRLSRGGPGWWWPAALAVTAVICCAACARAPLPRVGFEFGADQDASRTATGAGGNTKASGFAVADPRKRGRHAAGGISPEDWGARGDRGCRAGVGSVDLWPIMGATPELWRKSISPAVASQRVLPHVGPGRSPRACEGRGGRKDDRLCERRVTEDRIRRFLPGVAERPPRPGRRAVVASARVKCRAAFVEMRCSPDAASRGLRLA